MLSPTPPSSATPERRALPALLSQVLVAHTIELDNEAEHQLAHRTTTGPGAPSQKGPWLVSSSLWFNVLQYIGPDGITVAELRGRARTSRLLLAGLRRWGYVSLTPPAGENLKNPATDGTVVRLRPGGRRAQAVVSPLPAVVDERWRTRFGAATVDRLEEALRTVRDVLPFDPPDYLPWISPTQGGKVEQPVTQSSGTRPQAPAPGELSRVLAGVLLAFTAEVESWSPISLAIGANTLRVLTPDGVRMRDLPRLTGVSKEAIAMSAGWLERHGHAITADDPTVTRGKVLRLTDKGVKRRRALSWAITVVEGAWAQRDGSGPTSELRAMLEQLAGDGSPTSSPLAAGLVPHADNWRARTRPALTLPYHPMVLHRGGFPDGS